MIKTLDENSRPAGAAGEHGAHQGVQSPCPRPLLKMGKKGIRRFLVVDAVEKVEKGEAGLVKVVIAPVFTHQSAGGGFAVPLEKEKLSLGVKKEGMLFSNEDTHVHIEEGNVVLLPAVELFRKAYEGLFFRAAAFYTDYFILRAVQWCALLGSGCGTAGHYSGIAAVLEGKSA